MTIPALQFLAYRTSLHGVLAIVLASCSSPQGGDPLPPTAAQMQAAKYAAVTPRREIVDRSQMPQINNIHHSTQIINQTQVQTNTQIFNRNNVNVYRW